MKAHAKKTLRVVIEIVLLVGLALLFLRVLDFKHLGDYFSLLTLPVFGGLVLFQLSILVLHAVQWDLLLREAGIGRGLWKTFWSRTSGFALTYLTPSFLFGGEPVRAKMYKDAGMGYDKLSATIVLDKYIELSTKIPCILVGFAFLIMLARPRLAVILFTAAVLGVIIGFLVVLLAKMFTDDQLSLRLVRRLLRPLARFNPRLFDKVINAVSGFGASLHLIIRKKKVFYLALLIGLAITLIEVFQTFYILGVLHQSSLPDSFVIYATVLIQHIISILPANLGGMEATHLFIFNVLGLGSTQSFVYTVILRAGQLFMVALGVMNILVRRVGRARLGRLGRLENRARPPSAHGGR
jgi:uncharacterized protein (TIRG00374 family)